MFACIPKTTVDCLINRFQNVHKVTILGSFLSQFGESKLRFKIKNVKDINFNSSSRLLFKSDFVPRLEVYYFFNTVALLAAQWATSLLHSD
jgi:hypothetical protein